MSSLFLKVKIKSLAAESRIIRLEEDKLRSPRLAIANINFTKENGKTVYESADYTIASKEKLAKWKERSIEARNRTEKTLTSLTNHRKLEVRNESRAALLAYAFIRGKSYAKTENSKLLNNQLVGPNPKILQKVASIVTRFGRFPVDWVMIESWVQGDNERLTKGSSEPAISAGSA